MIPEEIKQNKYRLMALDFIKNNEFLGSTPPGLFVGEYGYPYVNVSLVSPTHIVQNARFLDTPEQWFGLDLNKFIAMRQQLVHAGKKMLSTQAQSPTNELQSLQELLMSKNSLTVDVKLEKQPLGRVEFNEIVAPVGPSAFLRKFSLEDTPKISRDIEKSYYDSDLKAETAVLSLYDSGLEISSLYKLLSAGVFGVEKNRKLVPSKWAITATDDMVSKNLISEIKQFEPAHEIQLFESHYLDNHFFLLFVPGSWSFEMMECWKPNHQTTQEKIAQDHEFFEGRTTYAHNITGAYYSARLAAAEYLLAEKKQASCLVFREIGPAYEVPVGVWEVRENARHAFYNPSHSFPSIKSALDFIGTKLKAPLGEYKKKSDLLDFLQNQSKITNWF
ncbi:MAG: hypothetical protein Q7S92_01875 [Candidatus Diapherotrites archaeon]|nr:hypothetical protein [Candidatus Diapherotrites archaeon]